MDQAVLDRPTLEHTFVRYWPYICNVTIDHLDHCSSFAVLRVKSDPGQIAASL